ncbi:MAG TPA: carboxypeptidase-like regulatory domain-containing protein [Terracidiphilus sp.]
MPSEPSPEPGELSGTVTDLGGDLIPGATVALDSTDPASHLTQAANDSAFFQFRGLKPGVAYRVTVSAKGFENWVSSPVVLTAGQFFDVPGIKLKLEDAVSSVTVYSSTEQIATQQVEIEEHQRIMGFIPNFYVVYDAKNAVPLTTKLKFQMAYRVSIDPVSIVGAATLAGMNQAGNTPNYRQGAIGYGERFGAAYADGVTDVMFGGAILPALLHQDPRYFYQGTGTVKSRLMHAMAAPFVCRGDNGKNEVNFSSMGGDLISGSISNAYYPPSNRGAGLVFEGFGLSTGERVVSTVIQEFLLKKLTPNAKNGD